MPENKSHHYVPQMYMRLFSDEDEKCVGVFALEKKKFIPSAPIKGQACKNYFYGKDGKAEKSFGKIETRVRSILREIIDNTNLPANGSEEYEFLMLYLALQHCRTTDAEAEHMEAAEKTVKSMLHRKATLEGNQIILDALPNVRIKRTNAISETVRVATVGASLLTDLNLMLLKNETDKAFISSDVPVVLHNRIYEDQTEFSATGFASVGLQVFLPLGPRYMLVCYDPGVYRADKVVHLTDLHAVNLLNELQWEAANKVLLVSPETTENELYERAANFTFEKEKERTIFREEVMSENDGELRTRHGSGAKPSSVLLDLPFISVIVARPDKVAPFEHPPIRDELKMAKVEAAFNLMTEFESEIL